jgi:hypothetical protein
VQWCGTEAESAGGTPAPDELHRTSDQSSIAS